MKMKYIEGRFCKVWQQGRHGTPKKTTRYHISCMTHFTVGTDHILKQMQGRWFCPALLLHLLQVHPSTKIFFAKCFPPISFWRGNDLAFSYLPTDT